MKNPNEALNTHETRIINGDICKYHHTATTAGYVSVKCEEAEPIPYKGHFGEGYKIRIHNPESTQYCYVQYWIKEGGEKKWKIP